ncbi:hypothetical protein CDD83_6989 [Cordyceps sp. RAO-2017]|nr:hypothetical protein CDD83_6989 [Cordyceps sp. RAO-2017]
MAAEAVPRLVAWGSVVRRDLDDGAIAGTVVGVVIGAALIALCLYPVVIHLVKRRRRPRSLEFDAEHGAAAAAARHDLAGLDDRRRLSSTDSFKHDGDLSRGDSRAAPVARQWGWPSRSQAPPRPRAGHSPPRQLSSSLPDTIASDRPLAPAPFYEGEYMPVSEVRDDHPGVLQGTSADYYSPSIPSEAFGMVTSPDEVAAAGVTASRGSSFRYNVRHMFRRKSGRDAAVEPCPPAASSGDGQPVPSAAPQALQGVALQQITPTGDPAAEPSALSHQTSPPPAVASAAQTSASPSPPPPRPPPQLPVEQPVKVSSPSPPAHPAPGTVNPMDIMPASTESELWYRNEHELLSAYRHPAAVSPVPDHEKRMSNPDTERAPSVAPPTPSTTVPHQAAAAATESATPTQAKGQDGPQGDDVLMTDAQQPHPDPSPPAVPEPGRYPSHTSDLSTLFQGPGSTDLSSHNTPSTQLDSPTPESLNSSDFRHSVSPQSGNSTLKMGIFRCDVPGCQQVFDQPHKLKHHQRYHSKDHKCPYANCEKGFGTKTHLHRHINDRHEKKKKFHCSVPGCDYSRAGGKGFPRKDNWKRHMIKTHHMDHAHLPEPIEVDPDTAAT